MSLTAVDDTRRAGMDETDEFDVLLRSLEAERYRPVPPRSLIRARLVGSSAAARSDPHRATTGAKTRTPKGLGQ